MHINGLAGVKVLLEEQDSGTCGTKNFFTGALAQLSLQDCPGVIPVLKVNGAHSPAFTPDIFESI